MPYLDKPSTPKKVPYKKSFEVPRIYDERRWYGLRNEFKVTEPLCWNCLLNGHTESQKELHHIIPFNTGFNLDEVERLAFDPDNLMPLCYDCHDSLHYTLNSDPSKYCLRIEEIKIYVKYAKNVY